MIANVQFKLLDIWGQELQQLAMTSSCKMKNLGAIFEQSQIVFAFLSEKKKQQKKQKTWVTRGLNPMRKIFDPCEIQI